MIRLRRSLGSLLVGVVALLSLVLRTGDMCATLPAEAVGAAAHQHEAAHHEDAPAGERAHGEGHDATAPKHCVTAAACATTIALAPTLTIEEPAPVERTVIAASDDTAPASARGAPEPPPPRA